jgi:hypothetical protein
MKHNLVVMLADFFNLLEIHPAPCVDFPEAELASGEFTTSQQLAQFSASFAFSSLFLVNMFVVCEKFLCATRERNRKEVKQWMRSFSARRFLLSCRLAPEMKLNQFLL